MPSPSYVLSISLQLLPNIMCFSGVVDERAYDLHLLSLLRKNVLSEAQLLSLRQDICHTTVSSTAGKTSTPQSRSGNSLKRPRTDASGENNV
jgi:hypothetical protein